jgi:hypothetical protein
LLRRDSDGPRVVHFFGYTFRVPWLRTHAFAVGWAAQIAFAWQILM